MYKMSKYKYQPLVSSGTRNYTSVFSYSNGKESGQTFINDGKYEDFSLSLPTKIEEPRQAWLDCFVTFLVKVFCLMVFVLTLPFSALFCFKLCHQFERIVLYRLGRLQSVKGPGVVFILPCIDSWNKIDMRTKAFNIPPTRLRTTDGCIVSVGGVIHFRVQNPILMTSSIQDMNHAVREISQSVMANFLCKKNINDIMNSRGKYNYDIQIDINTVTKDWGLEISRVELSQVNVEVTPNAKSPFPQQQAGMGDNLSMETIAMMAQQFMSHKQKKETNTSGSTNTLAALPSKTVVSNATPDSLLEILGKSLNSDLVAKVNASYELTLDDINEIFFIDLTSGNGRCGKGKLGIEPDVHLGLSFLTLQKLLSGDIGAYDAYSSGELRVHGDKSKALELDKVVACFKANA